jgi:hypothetical protein
MNIENKLRRASLIIAAGLFLQFVSLLPLHPLAFIAFVGLGVPVMGIGVLLFLLSLVTHSESQGSPPPPLREKTQV